MSRALLRFEAAARFTTTQPSLIPRVPAARRAPEGQRRAPAYLDILSPAGTPSRLRARRRPPNAAPSSRQSSGLLSTAPRRSEGGMSRALLRFEAAARFTTTQPSLIPRVPAARRAPEGQRRAPAYLDILSPAGTPSRLRARRRPPNAAPSSRRASVSHFVSHGACD